MQHVRQLPQQRPWAAPPRRSPRPGATDPRGQPVRAQGPLVRSDRVERLTAACSETQAFHSVSAEPSWPREAASPAHKSMNSFERPLEDRCVQEPSRSRATFRPLTSRALGTATRSRTEVPREGQEARGSAQQPRRQSLYTAGTRPGVGRGAGATGRGAAPVARDRQCGVGARFVYTPSARLAPERGPAGTPGAGNRSSSGHSHGTDYRDSMDWSHDDDMNGCDASHYWEEVPLPCGLLPSQVSDILFRELTPEDYDLLLHLDESIERRAASRFSVDSLPRAWASDFLGESCTVCLGAFEEGDSVAALPCKHFFHRSCIERWLTERRPVCPLCSSEVFPPS